MSDADKAFQAAERLLADALESGAEHLNFDQEDTHALTRLPDSIAQLQSLISLDCDNTQISDLGPLSDLTGLVELGLSWTFVNDLCPLSGPTGLRGLWLDGTPAIDLRPLRGLRHLVKDPSLVGLTFADSAAAQADPHIAENAKINRNAVRARKLFDYLKD